jgi:hypothetical protein
VKYKDVFHQSKSLCDHLAHPVREAR